MSSLTGSFEIIFRGHRHSNQNRLRGRRSGRLGPCSRRDLFLLPSRAAPHLSAPPRDALHRGKWTVGISSKTFIAGTRKSGRSPSAAAARGSVIYRPMNTRCVRRRRRRRDTCTAFMNPKLRFRRSHYRPVRDGAAAARTGGAAGPRRALRRRQEKPRQAACHANEPCARRLTLTRQFPARRLDTNPSGGAAPRTIAEPTLFRFEVRVALSVGDTISRETRAREYLSILSHTGECREWRGAEGGSGESDNGVACRLHRARPGARREAAAFVLPLSSFVREPILSINIVAISRGITKNIKKTRPSRRGVSQYIFNGPGAAAAQYPGPIPSGGRSKGVSGGGGGGRCGQRRVKIGQFAVRLTTRKYHRINTGPAPATRSLSKLYLIATTAAPVAGPFCRFASAP
ncbi:hypothetical protein EVAR_65837_1 [Eumeta japonica]|uniref:Uncharacterized protein n=1 Tax=Eumeta variegata TaxID=151549 RepID=A0A4C1ZP46_EUMVA|nr:hypothetical protein EVAR_65837_1 [Eumeta japonica]